MVTDPKEIGKRMAALAEAIWNTMETREPSKESEAILLFLVATMSGMAYDVCRAGLTKENFLKAQRIVMEMVETGDWSPEAEKDVATRAARAIQGKE